MTWMHRPCILHSRWSASLSKFTRNVYIARSRKPLVKAPPVTPEHEDLKEQVKKVDAYASMIRQYIKEQEDKKLKEQVAASDNKASSILWAPEDDIDALDQYITKQNEGGARSSPSTGRHRQISGRPVSNNDGLVADSSFKRGDLFASPARSLTLSPALLDRIGTAAAFISTRNPEDQNWSPVLYQLYKGDGFKGLAIKDVESLAISIPTKKRADPTVLPLMHEMMQDAGIEPSKLILNLTMAAYAARGQTVVVRAFFDDLVQRGIAPDVHTYAHLINAYAKTSDIASVSKAFSQMQDAGLTPTLPVYTTVLQTYIRTGDYKQAFQLFETLKYMSLETQPDVNLYNSLMLAAAKQYNVEKVLDLYKEMTTRAIAPVQPDEETYNILIYACAKHPNYHLQAWKYLLEMRSLNFPIGRKAINALMYLCGTSGELLLARAMVRQLCLTAETYPDSFILYCLFSAYAAWHPGRLSPVMESEFGPKIRASFFFANETQHSSSVMNPHIPPFLPLSMLHDRHQVLAEARAVMTFFDEMHPTLINANNVVAYLDVFLHHGSIAEFRNQFEQLTYFDGPKLRASEDPVWEQPTSSSVNVALADQTDVPLKSHIRRTWKMYEQALDAATRAKDLDYAQEVWTERGKWRHTNAFKEMAKRRREQSDFAFARKMVMLFAKCGELEQALKIIKSTCNQFRWKRAHVIDLSDEIARVEDVRSARELSYLLSTPWRQAEIDESLVNRKK